MKKWIMGMMTLLLAITMTACSGSNGNNATGATDSGVTKEGKKVVTIAVMQKDSLLEQAAQTYEKLHTDIDIVIKQYVANPEDYFGNVFAAVKYEGKLVALPIHYVPQTIMANRDRMAASGIQIDDTKWSWRDVLDKGNEIIKKNKGEEKLIIMGNMAPSSLLSKIVLSEYNQYVDDSGKKANFNSSAFITLLKQLKGMYDKQLLSEDVQSSPGSFGFPVNRKALGNKILNANPMTMSTGKNGEGTNKPKKITDEEINAVIHFVDKVGRFVENDPQLIKMVQDGAEAFFKGEKTAEAVAALIQNRAQTYLNE